MFTKKLWTRGLIGFAVVSSVALGPVYGTLRVSKNSKWAEKPAFDGAGVPVAVGSILQRACSDCHSDNTVWPWYSALPPISWQVHGDVTRGRAAMNLSKWSQYSDAKRRGSMLAIAATTQAHIMPPRKYLWMHGDAKLSDAELKTLQDWVLAEASANSHNSGVISH